MLELANDVFNGMVDVQSHHIRSPHTVTVACEWSTGPAQHYSHLSSCLAGHDSSSVRRLKNMQAHLANT
jgi:hypothetical protein